LTEAKTIFRPFDLPTEYCLYCGTTGVFLGQEHIVPAALEGRHVIKKMSCRACERRTSAIEAAVTRGMWGDARKAYGAPRKKKKKWDGEPICVDEQSYKADTYPAHFLYYEMPKAGILQGFGPEVDLSQFWTLKTKSDAKRNEDWGNSGSSPVVIQFVHHPEEFALLLLKVAYCQILWSLNPDDFISIANPYILGEKKNPSYLVGGSEHRPTKTNISYDLQASTTILGNGTWLLSVHVTLLSGVGIPTYEAVVGYAVSDTMKSTISKKMPMSESTRRLFLGPTC
jgi:hypothetical protein